MNRWRPRTVRSALAWRSATIVFLFVVLLAAMSSFVWRQRVQAAIEAGVNDHLGSLEAELALLDDGRSGNLPVVLPAPERFVQVLDAAGKIIAASGELVGRSPLIDVRDVPVDATRTEISGSGADRSYLAVKRVSFADNQMIILVGASLAPAGSVGATYAAFSVLVAALAALLVWVTTWLSVRSALTPVADLAARADSIAHYQPAIGSIDIRPEKAEMSSLAVSLDRMLDQVRASIERERRFLEDASHELRTPIAVARGELDLLRSELADTGQDESGVESAIEELDRLASLAGDLLILAGSRSSSGSRSDNVDLAAVARLVVVGLERATSDGVHVAVHGNGSTMGDGRALQRALANLIDNALRYAESEVSVVIESEDAGTVVRVVDDGPGFSEAALGNVFDRFPKGRDRGGVGLGLSIAADIIQAHGGRIAASNLEKGGAEVEIFLPEG